LKQMKANPRLDYYQLFGQCSRMMVSLLKLPVPVIARVQGVAAAAGCQLVAQCDLAVAAEGVRFGVNGIDVGLFCGTPSVPLVRNMQPKQAMEMLLTGGFITAAEARARGLVNRVVVPDQLDAPSRTWCRPSCPSRARRSPSARSCFTGSASWASRRPTSWPTRAWPAT
jgi:enoyl-CoA hydratase/carnithine racemase